MAAKPQGIDVLDLSNLAINSPGNIAEEPSLASLSDDVLALIPMPQHDLFSMVLVNRRFHEVFTPLLYRFYHLHSFDESNTRHAVRLVAFAATVISAPQRARMVRELRLCGISDAVAKLVFNYAEDKWPALKLLHKTPNIYNLLWSPLPNLRELSFEIITKSQMDSLIVSFSPKLQTASFTDGGYRLGVEMSKIIRIIRLPVLRNLTVVLRNGELIADVPQLSLRRWPLESLDLQSAVVNTTSFDSLLGNMQALRSFGMTRPEMTYCQHGQLLQYVESTPLHSESIYTALVRFRNTLEELRLDMAQLARCLHRDDRMGTFAEFSKLRSLLVNPDLLGEFPENHPGISQFLPPSLEILMLVCRLEDPRRSSQYWFGLLESIAHDHARLRALRKVIIEFVYIVYQPGFPSPYSCAKCRGTYLGQWRVGIVRRCPVCVEGGKEWRQMLRIYFEVGIILEVRYINTDGGVEGILRELLKRGAHN